MYHYAGNNPVRYVDPDGKSVGGKLLGWGCYVAGGVVLVAGVASTSTGQLYITAGAAKLSLFLFTAGASVLTADTVNDAKNSGQSITPSFARGNFNSSAASSSPLPSNNDDNNNNKSSRNKPKEKGEPNSTDVERNPDGTVKRITQFDENGNFQKEIRPNTKNQHGINGPSTKVPNYNEAPDGRVFRNGNTVRPATLEEIELLQSY